MSVVDTEAFGEQMDGGSHGKTYVEAKRRLFLAMGRDFGVGKPVRLVVEGLGIPGGRR